MFSWPNKWEHTSFGRNKTSVELAQKKPSRPTLYSFYATPKHDNFHCRKKNVICQRAFSNKNCAMLAEKYQSRLFHDRCRLLSLQFIPCMKYA